MPRGRKPHGEQALTNAERQARYRANHLTHPLPVAVRPRRPVDRRSRPQRWATRFANSWRYRPPTPIGAMHCPKACKAVPLPRHSKLLSILISPCSLTSNYHEATAVINARSGRFPDPKKTRSTELMTAPLFGAFILAQAAERVARTTRAPQTAFWLPSR